MSISFSGKTALITGASSGLGECFARQFAEQGCHLILVARAKDKLESLAGELQHRYPVRIHSYVSDFSYADAPRRLFESIRKDGLSVDFLINNAGFGNFGNFDQLVTEKDYELIQVNISAVVALTHLMLPAMLERQSGGILNVASTAAFQPLPKMSTYAASKAFVLNWSEALWAEFNARGVRIFCLCPGNTRTQFHQRANMDQRYAFLMAEPDAVVRFALQKFAKTQSPTAVYGWINKILACGYRFAPRSWVARITSWIYP